jgi:hypothetical protein
MEGRVIKEIAIQDMRRIVEISVLKPIRIDFHLESDKIPLTPAAFDDRIEFELERVAGDGVLIYRRITPLWNRPKKS